MQERKLISSGAKWEDIVGYSRAVRIGNLIEVSGTAAVDEKGVVAPGNAYLQARFIIEKIQKALQEAGAGLEDVIRTRIYVVEIAHTWEEVARAHGEFFGTIKPASTMVEVKSLIDPDMLVEIEVTALLQ
ncbi:MAG: RidA family protein [Ignavibacteriaceae bacterium]|nr:RidA family protein [Ignavibacteriaceae bacterium]